MRRAVFGPYRLPFAAPHENFRAGFLWVQPIGSRRPADKASRFRGSTPVSRCEAAGNRLVRRCIPAWVSRTHPLPARACSICKAAQPLTAALPYRFRKFSVLSTVSDLWPLTGGLSAVNKSGFDALAPFMTRQSMLSLIPPERSEGWTTTVTGSLPLHSKV